MRRRVWLALPVLFGMMALVPVLAQPPQEPPEKGGQPPEKGGPPPFGGPMMGGKRLVVSQFDKDGDNKLNKDERVAAREFLKKNNAGRGFFPKGGFGKGKQDPPKPGPKVAPADVKNFPDATLYEPTVLRTIFLQFEDNDWEAEMADFYHTDVSIPATMTVDGKTYPNVGVGFRGASSYFTVGAGFKRSLNGHLNFGNDQQRLYGAKTLNLLNAHDDPTFLGSVVYSHIARQHLPTPKVNLVKVVINGESWGVYVNEQQFDKQFVKENFKTDKGDRWKVQGNPGNGAGLRYIGDNVEDYKRRYQLKSDDNAKSWKALIALCKALNQTPPDQLEEALKPILDIDSLLWFLAIDNAVINCDGYWIRASDFSLFRDPKGIFHIVPHDFNECFRAPQGPGFGGGPGGFRPKGKDGGPPGDGPKDGPFDRFKDKDGPPDDRPKDKAGPPDDRSKDKDGKDRPKGGEAMRVVGVGLDPLVGLTDVNKPLRSKILAVPKFRDQYLRNMRTLAEESFDWKTLGPVIAQYRALIEKEVEADTRKLYSNEDFLALTADNSEGPAQRRGGAMNLRTFMDQRRKYLLDNADVKKAGK